MNSKNYKHLTTEISQKLNDYFSKFCEVYPQYNSIKTDYLKKSIHLNGVQFYAGFTSGPSSKWSNFIEVPIAIELTMLWAYKTNRILDEKQAAWATKETIKSTVLEHDLMLACIFDLLAVFSKKNPGHTVKVKSLIEKMLSQLPFGFWIEKTNLNIHYSSLEKVLVNWNETYLARNLNFNLVYEYAPLIGYALSSEDFDIIKKYFDFIPLELRFSNIGQMINDLGDFGEDIDANIKSFQDMFADIRNGIITFPVYKLINEIDILDALKKPQITLDKSWQNKIRKLILSKNLNGELIKIASESYDKYRKFFESNIPNSNPLLLKSFGMLTNNKYFDQKIVFEVSPFFRNRVVLCNINGRELGTYDKLLAHKEGKLHKAFSIFVFNSDNELLIQKRAKNKYHSGSLWANTCCSHLISGEDLIVSAKRRLKEEMGFECEQKKKFSFVYKSKVGNGLIEHEFDTILIGKYDGKIKPNPEEVEDTKWIKMEDLVENIKNHPTHYASWFKIILERMGYR